jgi:D-amino-acid dehydrogenase
MQTATALDSLIRLSTPEHRRLLGEAGESRRLRDDGWIFLYRSEQGFAASRPTRDTLNAFGVSTQVLDAKAVSDLEPSLQPIFPKSLWVKDGASVDNPGCVVEAYARLFVQRGGSIVKDEIAHLSRVDGRWNLHGVHEPLSAAQVVVALGPWAKQLLAPLGLAVPMVFERGYHMHYGTRDGAALRRPVYDTSAGYVMSPMEHGIRLTTGVELADIDAPKSLTQLESAEASAREAFPLGGRLQSEPWLGRRPTLPDSRPMIGKAPRLPGLWLAFGHQHIGFSTSTGTALLLGAMMQDERPPIDAWPFDPSRFVA